MRTAMLVFVGGRYQSRFTTVNSQFRCPRTVMMDLVCDGLNSFITPRGHCVPMDPYL